MKLSEQNKTTNTNKTHGRERDRDREYRHGDGYEDGDKARTRSVTTIYQHTVGNPRTFLAYSGALLSRYVSM